MSSQDKLEEIFALCLIGSNNTLYFSEVAQVFWPVLDNCLTLCDLSGIFSIANPRGQDYLDFALFREFMNSISRVKYPTEANHLALLIEDIVQARQVNYNVENNTFKECMDKNIMRSSSHFQSSSFFSTLPLIHYLIIFFFSLFF